jgi:hypothetical protein
MSGRYTKPRRHSKLASAFVPSDSRLHTRVNELLDPPALLPSIFMSRVVDIETRTRPR